MNISFRDQEPSSAEAALSDALTIPQHREWLASIMLGYAPRRGRTALVDSKHYGPLRVQRAFYPETDGTCHTYLLHPPGGMAVGDKLTINAQLSAGSSTLLTTPSAGKMYGMIGVVNAENMPQVQEVTLGLADDARCEWLPQETIIFNGAQAKLNTTIELQARSQCIAWDIVRLGRAASGERFEQGYCKQKFSVYREGELLFREYNPLIAGSEMQNAVWGLQNRNTLATLVATVQLDRDQVDSLVDLLKQQMPQRDGHEGVWGITQKETLLIARYLGDSILECRAGLSLLWQALRPIMMNKEAVIPRIWNT